MSDRCLLGYLFPLPAFDVSKRVNRKVQEEPQAEPLTPEGREKVRRVDVCIANKQMHDKHKDQLPFPQSKVIKMLKGQKKHMDKEQGKAKHEAPCTVNYRATQNKNNSLF